MSNITLIGITNYRDKRIRFGIKENDRKSHMYIIGKTGTGKSTLIKNMAISDIVAGKGLALIDPHGDLAEDLLRYIPKQRIRDLVYFNPANTVSPIAFNPLANTSNENRSLVVSGLISVFKKTWPDFWGPRLEHILRYSLLTLMEYPQSTLLDIPRLLTDKDFRRYVLEFVEDRQTKDFWFSEFDRYSVWLRAQAISPILNKVGQFLASPYIRNIVGQPESAFDIRQVMDKGGIFIANLTKGKIGEDNCALLGAMLVTKIELSALSRADIPESSRNPFYLYVDEIHNFLTQSFADILSESRKYGLNLILAHQHLEQLDEKMRTAVFGNCGTFVAFRVSADDAKCLAQEFQLVFKDNEFIDLPNYHIYIKLMIDGIVSQPFSAITIP